MAHTNKSIKTSVVVGIVVASVCILVYLGALVSVIIRINTSMEQRRMVAEEEFYKLADLATSAGALGFMDDTFIEIIQNELEKSMTLEGIIISGPNEGFGFEKEQGKAIEWVNGLPRFRNRFDFSRQQLYLPLRIENLRNVNIQAVAGAFDYADLAGILRQAMLLITAALAVAFIALILESLRKRGARGSKPDGLRGTRPAGEPRADNGTPAGARPAEGSPGAGARPGQDHTGVNYSQRGRVVREDNTELRLNEELQRCVAGDHDLAFIVMEFKPAADDSFYVRFAADTARFFSSRDFVCEKGERGITVICPGLNLDAGFLNANEFHNRIIGKYPNLFKSKTDLCMGISARSARPINAKRLMFEAEEALERAMMDPVSHIVAFKSDPEKYRSFMAGRQSSG